ncbi:dihydrofolate reductase [Leuconostocaceae bacterium ESL0958]|nr:dihydrofolate reductase [Leuconostocaceae bacterium ESL0958]
MPTVRMVWAQDEDRAIGKDGRIPWFFPKDLAHFKAETIDSTMVMGRATYESIGRALPGRENVVLTSQRNYDPEDDRVRLCHTLTELEQLIQNRLAAGKLVTVAGGAQLYQALWPLATELVITKIPGRHDGDTFVTGLTLDDFRLVSEWTVIDQGQALVFQRYQRQKGE